MNITFIGIGNVGSALARNLINSGHTVTVAAHRMDSESVVKATSEIEGLSALPTQKAVAAAEIIFLTTPYAAAKSALQGAGDLTGKIIVDCTNPVGTGLTHGLESKTSGGEQIQEIAGTTPVVKAFTIYGYENFRNSNYPNYGDLKPAMLIAGDDADAKASVSQLCQQLGWEAVDTGGIANSLHLEHMTLLWIKMARVQGVGSDLVWARLRR